MIPLLLPQTIAREIEAAGAAAFPNECCGMLIGREISEGGVARRIVDRIEPADNAFAADEQYHRFSIHPLQQLKSERAAQKEGKILVGFYHSHPDHPARPSEYDREHAWETFSYVIVRIQAGEPREMTSWMLDEKTRQFAQQEIIVQPDKAANRKGARS
jgi:proteasome lid subunit RPN8/RPN11